MLLCNNRFESSVKSSLSHEEDRNLIYSNMTVGIHSVTIMKKRRKYFHYTSANISPTLEFPSFPLVVLSIIGQDAEHSLKN